MSFRVLLFSLVCYILLLLFRLLLSLYTLLDIIVRLVFFGCLVLAAGSTVLPSFP